MLTPVQPTANPNVVTIEKNKSAAWTNNKKVLSSCRDKTLVLRKKIVNQSQNRNREPFDLRSYIATPGNTPILAYCYLFKTVV